MDLIEKQLSEELIYKGSYLEYTKVKVELPNGDEAFRDVIKHPGAAAIIAFKDDENIILVEQFRKALDSVTLEIPAGKLDKDEDHKLAALRELEEETGYKALNIEYLGKIAPAAGFCNEILYLYKATNLIQGNKNCDEDEFTNVKIISLSELKDMIKKGGIIDAKTICSLAYL